MYTSFTINNGMWIKYIVDTFTMTTGLNLPDHINISQGQHEIVRILNGIRYSTFVTPPASANVMDLKIGDTVMTIDYFTRIDDELMDVGGSQLFNVNNAGLEKVYLIKIK